MSVLRYLLWFGTAGCAALVWAGIAGSHLQTTEARAVALLLLLWAAVVTGIADSRLVRETPVEDR
ncbi:hypothetical protein GCM10027160_29330 [Streptomyces calidiresistens]|uniref:Uncharacterized protein n=1 Tax=Streptomyces calidiresistens TaxID=1485586 RepID=A0A7W3T7G1_9ACTN|nr:hypothetical protein [Streptomyces calidiresistens]MBB0232213.1 hypothetical protein [Streptomyces calidiresistens]